MKKSLIILFLAFSAMTAFTAVNCPPCDYAQFGSPTTTGKCIISKKGVRTSSASTITTYKCIKCGSQFKYVKIHSGVGKKIVDGKIYGYYCPDC